MKSDPHLNGLMQYITSDTIGHLIICTCHDMDLTARLQIFSAHTGTLPVTMACRPFKEHLSDIVMRSSATIHQKDDSTTYPVGPLPADLSRMLAADGKYCSSV